jgi:hypothetical protein
MKTTKDHAAEIRAQLKAAGIKPRLVSVRCEFYSLGSSIAVKVRSPYVSISKVKEIVAGHARIDRDEHGEILNGGNRYCDAEYDREIVYPYADAIERRLVALKARPRSESVEILGESCWIAGDGYWRSFGRGDDDMGHKCYDETGLARQLAEAALDRGEADALLAECNATASAV